MSTQNAGGEPQVGDEDFMDMVQDDRARARMLRKQVQQLADSDDEVLQEMSREILTGRVGVREALRIPAYADALGERVSEARQTWERMSPEEQESAKREAERFLEAQREEIEREEDHRSP